MKSHKIPDQALFKNNQIKRFNSVQYYKWINNRAPRLVREIDNTWNKFLQCFELAHPDVFKVLTTEKGNKTIDKIRNKQETKNLIRTFFRHRNKMLRLRNKADVVARRNGQKYLKGHEMTMKTFMKELMSNNKMKEDLSQLKVYLVKLLLRRPINAVRLGMNVRKDMKMKKSQRYNECKLMVSGVQ